MAETLHRTRLDAQPTAAKWQPKKKNQKKKRMRIWPMKNSKGFRTDEPAPTSSTIIHDQSHIQSRKGMRSARSTFYLPKFISPASSSTLAIPFVSEANVANSFAGFAGVLHCDSNIDKMPKLEITCGSRH